ncbi:MAG: polysaccharide deacetylase family protein, partial [Planctomycetota bacterium]
MDNPTDKPERSLADEATQIVGRAGGFSFGGLHPVGVSVHDPLPASAGFPGQARAAVLLTFDVEGNYGNGLGEVSRELDNYRRICDRLDRLGLVATFNVVGQMVDDHGPGFVKVMHQAGSEVASHGYWHDLNRRFGGPRVYAGQYGPQENYLQVTRGVQALEAVLPEPVRGIRMPYGHFNEY